MIIRFCFFLFSFFITSDFFAQRIKSYVLDNCLQEISGIEIIGDSLIIAHNDGGNDALLYVLDLTGKIIHTCKINNVHNTDWEDLTTDNKGNLYIGDIGNNANKRKKITLLRIPISQILHSDSSDAEIYSFSYPEQTDYPPNKNQRYFDAESLVFYHDSLWIFTKCRTRPYDGKSYVYASDVNSLNEKSFEKMNEIIFGMKSWTKDSFTAGTCFNNLFYLLTYKKLLILERKEGGFLLKKTKRFHKMKQRESIAISNKYILIANESHPLLGKQKLTLYGYE